MSSEDRFSHTVPASLDPASSHATEAREAEEAVLRQSYDVVGSAGMQLAEPMAELRKLVDAALKGGQLSNTLAAGMVRSIDAAARIAMQARLLARLASGSVRHRNEQVALDPILNQLIDLHQARLAQGGAAARREIRPVTVLVDRDLATALLDAAIEWGGSAGEVLSISLEIKNWPAHGMLYIRTRHTKPAGDGPSPEILCWYLIGELARTVGATVDRVRSAGETLLMLEFPRTVREMEGLTAMEVELGLPAAAGDASRVLAGRRALIVTSDVRLREEAKRVCQALGLTVESVPSSMLALQRCQADKPDALIVDERFNDERFQQLRQELSAQQPNFPIVEIAYGRASEQPVIGWGGDQMTRVSRELLAAQLPQALTLEMSKAL